MKKNFSQIGSSILEEEAHALHTFSTCLNSSFEEVIDCLLHISGRIAVTGMGKSGHIAKKVAATLSSTGSPAFFIHPAEASHGDLGMLGKGDAVLAFSNSGDTHELTDIIAFAARHRLPLIAVTRQPNGLLGKNADYVLQLPDVPEACPIGCAPTTSTTMQLALGDAIALTLLQARGFTPEDFREFHPGGKLGKKLQKVRDIMHVGDAMPLASINSSMGAVICVISGKGFGAAGIIDEHHKLVGFISDGDLRRHMSNDLLAKSPAEIMSPNPFLLSPDCLAAKALVLLKERKICSSFVLNGDKIVGFIHLHDLL